MKLDLARLISDLEALATESRALKVLLRRRWTRPMADEQRRLARVRHRTTELCILRAMARGKWHVRTMPRACSSAAESWDREAWHAAIALRVAKDYAPAVSEPRASEKGAS